VGDIIFEMVFVIENSNKFQKTKIWKEKSIEDVVTSPFKDVQSILPPCDSNLYT
jgi:uncharacterized membrane protein required for colicin V production